MGWLRHSISVLVLCGLMPAYASWNLSLEGDGRGSIGNDGEAAVEIHAVALQVRKTVADKKGDRFNFSALLETRHNFDETMLHELYGRYKGPLGKWNITAGRFSVPFGLLYSFNTDRLPFDLPVDMVIGIDADNGIMLSGIAGRLDYAAAVTQGYGHHHTPGFPGHGLVTARLGFTPGDTEELSFGISAAGGKTAMHHHKEHAVERYAGVLDATVYWMGFLNRLEAGGGVINAEAFASLFVAMEYALLPGTDILFSTTHFQTETDLKTSGFAGIAVKPPWFTLRGGYEYAYEGKAKHRGVVQIYRLFSVRF